MFMTGLNLFPNASAWVKAFTALSAYVLPSLFLSSQVNDTGPMGHMVLWFAMANQEETSSKCSKHWVLKYFQICLNDDPELTLTYFTARSNLIPYAFVWEKGKIMDLFRNHCSL